MSLELEDIREKKSCVGLYVVIGLLLVGMAGFGTSQYGGLGSNNPAALKLGDAEISVAEFNHALNNNRQRYADMNANELEDLTISQLRNDLALSHYLDNYPFAASNQAIDTAIRTNVGFHENGQFSEDAFRSAISVEPMVYRKAVSDNLSKQDFQRAVVSTSIVSDAELGPYTELQNLSRDILVAKIARETFTNTANDEEIKTYFEEHKDEYKTDELINVEYIEINPETIASNISVSEKEILEASQPARNAHYYLFSDEASAKKLVERHSKGENIEDILKELNDVIDDKGEISDIEPLAHADSLIPQKAIDAIFKLPAKNSITEPMTIDGAIYVFELMSEPVLSLSDADKKQATEKLKRTKAAPLVAALNEKLNKAFFDSTNPDLATIAEQTDLEIKQSSLVPTNSNSGILAIRELVDAINNSDKKIGALQDPVTVGERVIIYRLTELKTPKQQPLEDVQEKVKEAIIAEKTNKQIDEAADALITATQTDGLEKAAAANNYPTKVFNDFKGQVEDNPVLDSIGAIFIMQQPPKLGQANPQEVKSINGDVYVYVNTGIRLGEAGAYEDTDKALQGQIANSTGQIELNSFIKSISAAADIKMRTGLLERNH